MPPAMLDWRRRIDRFIWGARAGGLPDWKKRGLRVVRMAIVLIRDVYEGQLTLWTMSLVYTSLLSMVPMLALAFSVLKAFGVHNQIEPLLDNLLAPLGEQGQEVSGRLVGFIEHMNVGVLGAVGLALLIYTVVSLLQKIEEAFNAIWHVTELRSLAERFTRYLSVLLIGPLLVFAALGITASAMSSHVAQAVLSIEPFGSLALAASTLAPYALVIGAFTFIYRFVPNTRVRLVPALVAGVIGGALWQSAGWLFAAFVVSSARYSAIYSSFAILVLFLIWLYVSWLVLLIGADVSFYVQHPEYLYAAPGEPRLSNRMRERLALAVMHAIASSFARGTPPWTLHRITQHLGIPMHSVNVVLDALATGGLVTRSGDDPPAYLPARDPRRVSVAEVLAMVRSAGEDSLVNSRSLPLPAPVEEIAVTVERAIATSVAGTSIAAMIELTGPVEATTSPMTDLSAPAPAVETKTCRSG